MKKLIIIVVAASGLLTAPAYAQMGGYGTGASVPNPATASSDVVKSGKDTATKSADKAKKKAGKSVTDTTNSTTTGMGGTSGQAPAPNADMNALPAPAPAAPGSE
jgi:hypothetical protein